MTFLPFRLPLIYAYLYRPALYLKARFDLEAYPVPRNNDLRIQALNDDPMKVRWALTVENYLKEAIKKVQNLLEQRGRTFEDQDDYHTTKRLLSGIGCV
jgi:hypothetical protein